MPTLVTGSNVLARTRITAESHERFGRFSGDLNPIHADADAARAMQPGGLLAYGMDMVLWALEALAETGQLSAPPARIRARFLKWVYLGDEITLLAQENAGAVSQSFQLVVNETPVARLEIFAGECQAAEFSAGSEASPIRRCEPRALSLEQMEGHAGVAAVPARAEAAAMYPALVAALGAAAIAELATCSYVIGMEAPGLYSMSMRYDLRFTEGDAGGESPGLGFRVVSVDPRFRKADIAVAGGHIVGTLEAFVREPIE